MAGHDTPPAAVDHGGLGLARALPLPFRIGTLIVLASWAWPVTVQILTAHRVNVARLLSYPDRPAGQLHASAYRLAGALTALLAAALVVFWTVTHDADAAVTLSRVERHDWIPLTLLGVFFAVLALAVPLPVRLFPFLPAFTAATHDDPSTAPPSDAAPSSPPVLAGIATHGRRRLRTTLRRVALGGLAEPRDGKFADVLLADVLTSFARVFADLFVAVCMACRSGGSATALLPDRTCGSPSPVTTAAAGLIAAAPSAIRLRQCLIEFVRVRRAAAPAAPNHHHRDATAGWGGQHLANALKYATAFPVVYLTAAGRATPADSAWLAAVLANSLYSFWWDVAKDWDLTLLSSARAARGQPYGLRRRRAFAKESAYYAVVALDLALRCTWALKLSPRTAALGGAEGSVFLVQALEVFRRWVWLFFRIETEHVRGVAGPVGVELDDVLLGAYQKDDDAYVEGR